jgi:hypothetical protein
MMLSLIRRTEVCQGDSKPAPWPKMVSDDRDADGRPVTMYRSAGYVEVPAFDDEPFAEHWFEKRLI